MTFPQHNPLKKIMMVMDMVIYNDADYDYDDSNYDYNDYDDYDDYDYDYGNFLINEFSMPFLPFSNFFNFCNFCNNFFSFIEERLGTSHLRLHVQCSTFTVYLL